MTWEYEHRHEFEKLCNLGKRVVAEFAAEILAEVDSTASAVSTLQKYARLDPKIVEAFGGTDFPAPPIHSVGGTDDET